MNDVTHTLVVGDLHGMFEVAEAALNEGCPVVFVGDYLDSFDRPVGDQFRTLELVLQANKERDDVTALFGNHEMSYMDPQMRCSGYSPELQRMLDAVGYTKRMRDELKVMVRVGDYLVTHAGISQRVLDYFDITIEQYLARPELWLDIGRSRGGPMKYGGLIWCDWNEDFVPVKGVKQIVGHTRGRPGELRTKNDNWCIDCVEHNRDYATVLWVPHEGTPQRHELPHIKEG
tara:strand:+ start:114 stop:806 length:693 start_codon:yes stop_codon:yes gene_type:complete